MQVLLEFALRALLIAAGTAAVLRILKVRTAAPRHAAWAGVMAAMLLLPLWTAWGPKMPLRLLPPPSSEATTGAAATPGVPKQAILPFGAIRLPSTPSFRVQWPWTTWLMGVYLVGASVLLMRLIAGTLRARSLVRQARRRDGKLCSASCAAPVTLGCFRPVVVLPETWDQWASAQLDAVLTHEHAHARRRDPLVQWLALFNRAVFWFHPLAWWLERRLAALAEEACDDAVLARGHDPHDYSQYLINLARSLATSGARFRTWGTAMPGILLEQRIVRILEGGPLPRLSRTRLAGTAAALMATSIISAAASVDYQRTAIHPTKAAIAPSQAVASEQQLPVRLARTAPVEAVGKAPARQMVLEQVARPPAQAEEVRKPEALIRLLIHGLSPAAEEDLRNRLQLRVGQLIDEAAFQHAREVVSEFDDNLRLDRIWVNVEARGSGVCLTVSPPQGGSARPEHASAGSRSDGALSDVPRRLHIAIEGLSDEAAGELRRRLAVREQEILDHEALSRELVRIHQIVTEFDPHLNDSRMIGRVPRTLGPGGKPIPPAVIDVTLIISARETAPQAGTAMEQHARVQRAPSLPNLPVTLHLDIQGLSEEATAELRQRLALREREIMDSVTFRQTVARIREVLHEFTPRLTGEIGFDFPPRRFGSDGKPIPLDSVEATMVIQAVGAAPKSGSAVR